jgi:hypothetical protein
VASGEPPVRAVEPVEIDLPVEWEQVGPVGPLAVMTRLPDHEGPLRPTIVVTDTVDPQRRDLDADGYAEAELAQAFATFGGHLVHLEVGHRPETHMDLMLAIEQLGVDATVVQRHLILAGGRAVVATGLVADVDWPDLAATVLGSVRSLRTARAG